MYEKYTGLPDTKKSASSKSGPPSKRPVQRASGASDKEIEYIQTPNRSSNGSTGAKRPNARRARERKRKMTLGLLSVALLALIVVAVVVLVKSCSGPAEVNLETGRFLSGVYINGMDLSGKTVDEVRAQLETNESYALSNISITLASEQINATISGADMNASSNLNAVIEQALSGGPNQVYYTTVSIDETALTNRINAINQTSSQPPVEPAVVLDFSKSSSPQYTEGKAGFGLDVTSTVALIKQTIESGQLQTTLSPTLTTVQPTQTLEEVKAHTAEIGRFTTTYSFKGTAEDTEEARTFLIPNRAFNIEKAAAIINGQAVLPGETWSFNKTVGDRNEKNGWKEANGIFGGDTLKKQFGGGVCQVSTTLFNALLEAYPYFTFERYEHSFPSTYVEKGLDATVDSGHIDFKFTNNSGYNVYICAYVSKNKMYTSRKRDITVVIYGQALPEGEEYKTRVVLVSEEPPGEEIITETRKRFIGDDLVQAPPRSKYVVDVFIDHYVNGQVVEPIFFGESVYEGNPGRRLVGIQPTPTPVPSDTPTPSTAGTP
ncbi:MAG: VanW family protein [Christensenella sp.]|nr:VanW family protein [Christensenella sp.]